MNIEYFHASKFGNGARVAAEFRRQMEEREVTVNVRHVKRVDPRAVPPSDLYVFSSPGRFGGPIGDMRRFLKKADLPAGARYALLATEFQANAAKRAAVDAGEDKGQRVIPVMTELLWNKGLVKVAETRVFVTRFTGPLEEGWEAKVADFASVILASARTVPVTVSV